MKTKLLLVVTLLAFASTSGFAQPQLSLGVTGGLQVYPTHGNTFKAGTSAATNYMSRLHKQVLIFVEPVKTGCNARFCLQA